MFSGYKGCECFEPREKLTKKLYRCDKVFHLDHVIKLYQIPKGKIGCVFVNGKDIVMNQIEPFTKKTFTPLKI